MGNSMHGYNQAGCPFCMAAYMQALQRQLMVARGTSRKNWGALRLSNEDWARYAETRSHSHSLLMEGDEDIGAQAQRIVVIPWAPTGAPAPDIEQFEVRIHSIDTNIAILEAIESKLHIPKHMFVLFTANPNYTRMVDAGNFARDYKLFEEGENKVLLVQAREEEIMFHHMRMHEQQEAENQAAKNARLQRRWRSVAKPDDVPDNLWTRYVEGRDALETEGEGLSDVFDQGARAMHTKMVKRIRKRTAGSLTETLQKAAPEMSEAQRSNLVEQVEEGTIPFLLQTDDMYSIEHACRVYSPINPGSFVDIWLSHYHKTGWSTVEIYRSLVAIGGTIQSDPKSDTVLDIPDKDRGFTPSSVVWYEYEDLDDKEPPKPKTRWANKAYIADLKQKLFGDAFRLTIPQFVDFLINAVGFTSAQLDGSPISSSETRELVKTAQKKFGEEKI